MDARLDGVDSAEDRSAGIVRAQDRLMVAIASVNIAMAQAMSKL